MDILERFKTGVWMYANAADYPEVARKLEAAADSCFEINNLKPSQKAERNILFRKLLGSTGSSFTIHSPFRCDLGFNIHIGENFIANYNLCILDDAEVHIGNNVLIGPNCTIITVTHHLDASERNKGLMQGLPVTIGDNVWIAANVVVLPGVVIGDNAVIGAGSVVTKDVAPCTVVAGNPARFLKRINNAAICAGSIDNCGQLGLDSCGD